MLNKLKTLIKYGAFVYAAIEVLEFAVAKFENVTIKLEPKTLEENE